MLKLFSRQPNVDYLNTTTTIPCGMRLLLIRHGETVDNVAGIYAGTQDSALTTHGVLQASRLASHLSTVKISYVFSSDLQRAFKTAEFIRLAQNPPPAATIQLELLREQDFGFYEGKSFLERQKGGGKSGKDVHRDIHVSAEGFRDVESKESMKARMDTFIDSHLVEHMRTRDEAETVVVVAHGIILSYLWRSILRRFDAGNITVVAGVYDSRGMGLEFLGGWSNTGYLDLEIKEQAAAHQSSEIYSSTEDVASPTTLAGVPMCSLPNAVSPETHTPISPAKLQKMSLVVKAVNSLEHLKGLKKTRGGIGSAKHDDKQKTVDSFFKKRRTE